jgi:hypothetical protein
VLKRWQFWILTVLALAQAGLVASNMVAFTDNRKLQAEVSQRAQTLQQTAQVQQLTREIAMALAQLGVRNQDPQIRAMLAQLGIAINLNETPTAAPPAAPEGKRK